MKITNEQRQRAIEIINQDLQHAYECGCDGSAMPTDSAEQIIDGLLSMIEAANE